ncbi:PIH1 domain-containing protein 1-like [Schistocerca cancellata]|uniref:PIH1 domain-containing protein 1-like n=1 Tax=Schistocerca cancellata TaxID=274614 RepID=UPI0021196A7A|nr:PIH1 domain-containing protein 1-like [Schistocerca cancellata]
MSKKSVFLDVDSSLLEKRLLVEPTDEEEIETLFPELREAANAVPWKYVQPLPGMCVKTKTSEGDKVFVNICHTEEIPKPADVTEDELMAIWNSDEAPSYRLPLSMGEPRDVEDKSGKPAKAFDVAINTEFFKKVSTNKVFRNFLLLVVMEGLEDKYKMQIDTVEYTILKNRKAIGTLQKHRIEQRPPKKGPLIQEIGTKTPEVQKQPEKKKDISDDRLPAPSSVSKGNTVSGSREPEYRIVREPAEGEPQLLIATFVLPDVLSAREIALDVGEDRIVFESRKRNYLLDIFIPYTVDQEKTIAEFEPSSRVLTLKMPVTTAT